MLNALKCIVKETFYSDLKRVYNNLRCINSTTTIGKATLLRVKVGQYVNFANNAQVINSFIDDYSSIGRNTTVFNVHMGKFCSISWNVTIGATSHPMTRLSTHAFYYVKQYGFSDRDKKIVVPTEVGHDVWVGANAIIMPGVKIGNGAVIGASAVVTKDVPPYAVVVGSPAKVVKYRFGSEMIEAMNEVQWWNWDREKLKRNVSLFSHDEVSLEDLLNAK